MSDDKPNTLTLPKYPGEQRSDREILVETNRLVRQLTFQGTTLEELERAMRVVDQSIAVLRLGAETELALFGAGITTVRKLLLQTPTSLVRREKIGRLARSEIIDALAVHGLRLASADQLGEECSPADEIGDDRANESKKPIVGSPHAVISGAQLPTDHCWPEGTGPLKEGDFVRHIVKPDWGEGKILSLTSDGIATVRFSTGGVRSLSLKDARLERMPHSVQQSMVPPEPREQYAAATRKVLCANCGQPTFFTDESSFRRHELGWCNSCFNQSQRTFKDSSTGETRYFDEVQTIDGPRRRGYNPK